jgi:hypothetical protein
VEEEDAAPDAEIAAYQEERRLTAQANPLDFWRCNSSRYPVLPRMVGYTHPARFVFRLLWPSFWARDFLQIPATSVPAEAVFSFASQIITKRRNRLCGETVWHIMCLHDWGPSDGPKCMVDDEELGDATGDATVDALDDALDGSSDMEMTSAED